MATKENSRRIRKLPQTQQSTTRLKKKLDAVFSQYIRRRNADIDGVTYCVTCHKRAHWKELQCGHYISRIYLATRYDEENCHSQCISCNIFKKGNMPSYTLYLQRVFGNDVIGRLYSDSQKITKYYPYQEKINYYKQKLNEMENSI